MSPPLDPKEPPWDWADVDGFKPYQVPREGLRVDVCVAFLREGREQRSWHLFTLPRGPEVEAWLQFLDGFFALARLARIPVRSLANMIKWQLGDLLLSGCDCVPPERVQLLRYDRPTRGGCAYWRLPDGRVLQVAEGRDGFAQLLGFTEETEFLSTLEENHGTDAESGDGAAPGDAGPAAAAGPAD